MIAYELLENHDGNGMNVLYGDGHVEFQPKPAAERITAQLNAGTNPPKL